MLKGSMMPSSWTCEIELGLEFQRRSLLDFNLRHKSQEAGSKIQYIQAPYPAPPLHPFTYRSIFFLFDISKQQKPQEISELLRPLKLKTTTKGAWLKVANLEVETARTDMMETIHHLTAKTVLQSLETEVTKSASDQPQLDLARQNGQHLGTTYGITSKWTSYVAVDRSTQASDDLDFYQPLFKRINLSNQREEDLGSDSDSDSNSHMLAEPDSDESDEYYSATPSFGVPVPPPPPQAVIVVSRESAVIVESREYNSREYNSKESSSSVPVPSSSQEREKMKLEFGAKEREEKEGLEEDIRKKLSRFGFQSNQIEVVIDKKKVEVKDGDQNDVDICWEEAATAHWQDSTGIFKLNDTVRCKLDAHFCAPVIKIVEDYIRRRLPVTRSDMFQIRDIEETLMLVQYFKTHLAKEQDVWEMMIEKAEYAVRQLLGVENDENALKGLQSILENSIMHVHFRSRSHSPAKDSQPFPPAKGIDTCPVCGAMVDDSRRESFWCSFEGCLVSSSDWDRMWDHQVKEGHIVCGPHKD